MNPCRKAEKEDLDDILRGESLLFSDPWSRKALEECLDSPVFESFVCTDGKSILGYLITSTAAGEAEILRIASFPEHRRKGVAASLLRFFLQRAPKNQTEAVFLEVRESNLAARNLYEKIGFRPSGLRCGYYSKPREDAVLYQLLIKKEDPKI
ncbi:MAG: ribosomal protein S18-alanine N-acetyltransferase [Clostridia bacterium]|nr:ribosomal protein S18-alanine N-acetyltransferase [Clostridia bacterium]